MPSCRGADQLPVCVHTPKLSGMQTCSWTDHPVAWPRLYSHQTVDTLSYRPRCLLRYIRRLIRASDTVMSSAGELHRVQSDTLLNIGVGVVISNASFWLRKDSIIKASRFNIQMPSMCTPRTLLNPCIVLWGVRRAPSQSCASFVCSMSANAYWIQRTDAKL